MQEEEEEEDSTASGDVPANAAEAAGDAIASGKTSGGGLQVPSDGQEVTRKRSLSKLAKSAIFREVVLAKTRELKAQQEEDRVRKAGTVDAASEKKA